MRKNAFTLIELLVVISVLGVLVAVLLPNLVGIRARARDSAVKNDLRQLKAALRLYYNDHQVYPPDDDAGQLVACGEAGDQVCPDADGSFSVGGQLYMKDMQALADFTYTQLQDGDDFLLASELENASDADLAASVSRCQVAEPVALTYYVCAD
jgi:prepilin-type N-terminal cleavage/methylation domain-containing protein